MLFGCKKSEDRNCFKSTGAMSVKEIELGEFSRLYMGPHLKYVLIQSDENKLRIVGGKNVINFVEPIIGPPLPKIFLIAPNSAKSPTGVLVPCALI